MKLSVVTTLYYSASYINEFYQRITDSIKQITEDYEIIFVNDGSPDKSLDIALDLFHKDKNIKIIDLSRNFGHHKAAFTGLQNSTGDYIFLIDVDLEEEPELIITFWNEMKNTKDADVIFGIQGARKGGWFEKISGNIYFTMFNFFSDIKIPRNLVMARLMTKRYKNSLLKHTEREVLISGLFALTGYNQKPIQITKKHKGTSVYNLKRKIDIVVNSITSYSGKPLIFIFYFGFIITLFSFMFIIYLLINKIFFKLLIGWLSIIASIWFLSGIIIFSIGVIGIYLSKIFMEVKQRPLTTIKNIYEK